jgi:hypothetical protein
LTFTGLCSSFGGPADSGMAADTGLTLYEPHEADREPSLFVPAAPGRPDEPTWRRLRTDAPYIALMFDGRADGAYRRALQAARWRVTGFRSGCSVVARLVDRGPHPDTGRLLDASPGLLNAVDCRTDDVVRVTLLDAIDGFRLDGRVRCAVEA